MKNRINTTKFNPFPMDRALPYLTAFRIFKDEFDKIVDKSQFSDNRKYKKFREGYWGLFACKALDAMEKKDHFMLFPEQESDGDVNFLSARDARENLMNKLIFDVKEYEEHSDSFEDFLQRVVIPKRNMGIYGLIIGLRRDVVGVPLTSLLTKNDQDRGVFIISSPRSDDNNSYVGRVMYVHKGELLFDQIININENFDETKPVVIYQNVLRDKTLSI